MALLVGVVQTLTQMHDPVVGLVPRLAVVLLVALVVLPWALESWVAYATRRHSGRSPNGCDLRIETGGAHLQEAILEASRDGCRVGRAPWALIAARALGRGVDGAGVRDGGARLADAAGLDGRR